MGVSTDLGFVRALGSFSGLEELKLNLERSGLMLLVTNDHSSLGKCLIISTSALRIVAPSPPFIAIRLQSWVGLETGSLLETPGSFLLFHQSLSLQKNFKK